MIKFFMFICLFVEFILSTYLSHCFIESSLLKMTKKLWKIHQKISKFSKEIFCSKSDQKGSKIISRPKNFFWEFWNFLHCRNVQRREKMIMPTYWFYPFSHMTMALFGTLYIYLFFNQTKRLLFTRGKSLLESWGTTFLPDWQPPLIFVWFTSKSHEN